MTTTPDPTHETHNIGKEICAALGLDAEQISTITIEPTGFGEVIVNVIATMYLTDRDDDRRADALIDYLKQYRLVPITDDDVHHIR